uniref:Uncharacterized protein n=1 Tax=Rhizophora mucronata TaxID=61149 RepID=A0A2P2P036_RHIMU
MNHAKDGEQKKSQHIIVKPHHLPLFYPLVDLANC